MKKFNCVLQVLIIMTILLAGTAAAEDFDPYLHQKAYDYQDWLMQWHSTGLGGVSDILFTDDTRTEILRTWGGGDSEDWTAMYLATQAMRYIITGEEEARAEVLRIAHYLHIVKDVTGDPGYLARYVAPDEPPWNVEFVGADNKYPGTGEYEGYFWIGKNVRDKYISWFWGLSWAWDAVDDPDMRATIEQDFRDVILTLQSNNWRIIDPWGHVYSAAKIMPDIRLSIVLQTAHVTNDPYYWNLLDKEYEKNKYLLWLTTITFFNRYDEYYAFINNYSNVQPLFRLWPDRERLEHLFKVWKWNVRLWSHNTHAAFFDAVYYQICQRLGTCNQNELAAIAADVQHGLTVMWEAPNYEKEVTCRDDLPIDPFSVWAHEILEANPWIGQLTGFDIQPQTLVAHEIDDRCWSSVLWERTPYHLECFRQENKAHTTHGDDYLIAYWLGVFYGLLPGDGPYGDDDPTDDDTVDDDIVDDDVIDDDVVDDDLVDDDVVDDDAFDDDAADDDAADDDDDDDDAADDDDDDDDDGCGC